jgi:hypothetical protein
LLQRPLIELPSPAAFEHVKFIIQKLISEKQAMQENVLELYEMLYCFGVLSSMSISYSAKLEIPGTNVFEIMPGGSLIKLPMPYKKIGYAKLGFNESICKVFRELWGVPDNHVTLKDYYPEIWDYYEEHFDEISVAILKERLSFK